MTFCVFLVNLEERYDRTGPVPNKLLYGTEEEFYTNALRRNAYNLKIGDRPEVRNNFNNTHSR